MQKILSKQTKLLTTLLALAYLVLGALGLMLAIPPGYASPIFPAAGVALTFVFLYGYRVLPGVWIGSALLNASHALLAGRLDAATLMAALLIAVGATVQALAGAWLVNRWQGEAWSTLEREQDALGLLILGGALACVLSASISVTVLYAAGIIEYAEFFYTWWNWYVGDAVGVLVFTPLTLCVLIREGELWQERRRRIVLPMLLTMGLVVLAFYGAARWEKQEQFDRLNSASQIIAGRIADRLITHREMLLSLRNFIEATPDFSFREFEHFTRITLKDKPDIFALSFNDLVTSDRRPEYERMMSRLSPLGSFQITERDGEGRLIRAADRPEYVAVRYIVPIEGNENAVGFDIQSEPVRRDAIRRARKSTDMSVTSPIRLIQENQERTGILEIKPVERFSETGNGRKEMRLVGFAVAVVKVDEAVEIATRGLIPKGLVFQLSDPGAPANRSLFFRSDTPGGSAKPLAQTADWKMNLRVGDRDWRLSVFTTKGYREQNRPWLAWGVGVAGLLFTALLQIMMLGMTGRTAVIQQKNEELKASEERYYRLFNDSPLPMWLYDATTRRFLMVNDRAVSHYGWTREEFLGMALPGVLPPGERPAAYGEGAMGTGPERTIEGRHVQKDGSLMDVVVHSSPASYGGAKAFVEVIQDVTREKKDRERLLLADKEKQMAEASSKAKSEFLASMSHEIRTPMNAIIGMADLLLESPLNEEQVKYVKVFRNAGENLLHIINDILDFSKIEAGQVQFESIPFSLKDLIQGLVEIMRFKAAERNIALSYELEGDMDDALVGDPTRLRQILLNLVGNALKFTYRGSVTITVERAGDGASDPESRSGDVDLIFAVKDTGIGIPRDVVDRIFDKFTQADTSMTRKFGGTGLGLTISKQLVRLMKGRIWVESTEGEGSTFSFSVRLKKDDWGSLAEGQGKGLPDLPGTEAARADRPLDILIVEDNDDNRLLLLSHLKKLPHRVDVAVDGREAVEKVVAGKAYDIIFMDIQMPVMDGYAATRHIRSWERDHNRIPSIIVALTAHAMMEDAQKSIEAGCNGHLTKPINKQEFMAALERFGHQAQGGTA